MKRLRPLAAGFLLFTSIQPSALSNNDIEFVEKFVFAKDRAAVLQELIPGTEDYYFYQALHLQHTEQHKPFTDLLQQWAERYPESSQREILKNRQALLDYERDPGGTLSYLKDKLNVRFNHQRDRRDDDPQLPEALDPAQVTTQAFIAQALRQNESLDKVTDVGLESLIHSGVSLSDGQRRALLGRVARPDFPQLVVLIRDELKTKESRGWGSMPIHQRLLKSQMDELLDMLKELRSNDTFVRNYLQRLAPNADVSLDKDPAAKQAHFERVWAFVGSLSPAFNSLKAHTLYHWLDFDRSQGRYDQARFLEYLKLPRTVHYLPSDYLKNVRDQGHTANLGEDFSEITGLPSIGNEEPLVVDYLMHFFADAESPTRFSKYLADSWINPIFATAKILLDEGDQEKWHSWLQPDEYQRLLERVDIDFVPENASQFEHDEVVSIAAHVKNVSNLIVKVYEIHTLNYYREHQREIRTDLNLDGLVANEELTFTYAEPPLRRVRREFTFPSLQGKRGAWMLEFIGNGKSSRALIRKGSLNTISRATVDGELTFVLDEENEVVKDAAIWLGSRQFKSESDDGSILIPFSKQPGRTPAVLVDGHGFAMLESIQVPGETYQLNASIHINREQLKPGHEATVLVRPQLLLNGAPSSLTILKDPSLTLTATNLDGIQTTHKIDAFPVSGDREATHIFRVPDRLTSLTVTFASKVQHLTDGTEEELSAGQTFQINGIDASAQTADFHLSRSESQWAVDMLGKNGEPQAQRAVLVEFRHRGFTDDIDVMMQTDARGRIALGKLSDIGRVKVSADGHEAKRWFLPTDHCHYQNSLHGAEGETLQLPYVGTSKAMTSEVASLLEIRQGHYVASHQDRLQLDGGFLLLKDMPAGDYELFLKESQQAITVRIAAGKALSGLVLGKHRQLTKRNKAPLQVTNATVIDDSLRIQLANPDPFTRVHVVATRYLPAFPLDESLAIVTAEPYEITLGRRPNLFTSGRKIGDEVRYVIDRRYRTTYPGNMLTRPIIILNPWEQRDTTADAQLAAEGEALDRMDRAAPAARRTSQMKRKLERTEDGLRDFANVDFLPSDGVVLSNLKPDSDGSLIIPSEALNGWQHVQILAASLDDSVMTNLFLPLGERPPHSQAFASSLPPEEHFSEQKAASVLKKDDSLVIRNAGTADLEIYDTLSKVHRYLVTKSGDATLTTFDFILRWPSLELAEKSDLFSKHACHELSVFIAHKDPDFFTQVVSPYLSNKAEKTFIDDYLLDHDLSPYLEAWRFARLNIAERALLAKRLGGESGQAIGRHLSDLLALKPEDLEANEFGFQTALGGLGLDRSSGRLRERELAASDFEEKASPFAAAAQADVALGEAQHALALAKQEDKSAYFGIELAQESLDEDLGRGGNGRPGLRALRAQPRGFYQKLDATKEWAENQYYQIPIEHQSSDLITINRFWNDYAQWSGNGAFLSTHFVEATKNFAEMMLALSVLDLPFEAPKHPETLEDGQLTLTADSGMLVFRREILPAPEANGPKQLLVNQNYYRYGHRYQQQGSEQVDHFVSSEFLSGVAYGCEVVITNPTSSVQKVQVLTQIPANAIPVLSTSPTKSVPMRLEPYSTQKLDYYFYFPQPGNQKQFPVHVAKEEQTIASAAPFEFTVVDKPSVIDAESWEYVSQWASEDEVLAYLRENNVHHLDLTRIAWRFNNAAFFHRVLALVEQRHAYDATLYSYALVHGATAPLRQYLQHRADFVAQCGDWLNASILHIDPTERHAYQHLEYSPLVNPRAHALGGERKILNEAFHNQYHRLLHILQYKPTLDAQDQLSIVYYLFLQDRVDEALTWLDSIDASQLEEHLQHDYFRAYAAFYREQPSAARQIALAYANYPVPRWQAVFANVIDQVNEIEGKSMSIPDLKDRDKRQDQLASTEPRFQFTVEEGTIQLTHESLTEVVLNYYEMDIEFLFSSNPFVSQGSERFGIIKPNFSERRQLNSANGTLTIPLPANLTGKNVLIEIEGGGQKQSKAHYSNTILVQLAENYGHLQVMHATDQRPLSKVYVKVYARKADGQVEFYKDGYTDLRGKFDYASLNANTIDEVKDLSLLVMSQEHGAVIREAKPPQQ